MQNTQITDFISTAAVQTTFCTEEKDCGLISYKKNIKHFKLKCFYCLDAFPICNWKDFIMHIEKRHQFVVNFAENDHNDDAIVNKMRNTINGLKCEPLLEEIQEFINNTDEVNIKNEFVEEDQEFIYISNENKNIKHQWFEQNFNNRDEVLQVKNEYFEAEEEILQEITMTEPINKTIVQVDNSTKLNTQDFIIKEKRQMDVVNKSIVIEEKSYSHFIDVTVDANKNDCVDIVDEFLVEMPPTKYVEQPKIDTVKNSTNNQSENKLSFVMKEILSSTNFGQNFLQRFNTQTEFDENHKKLLINQIVFYYIKHNMKLSKALYNLLAEDIIKMFPEENKDIYFYVDSKGRFRGKLYNAYNYWKKKEKYVKKSFADLEEVSKVKVIETMKNVKVHVQNLNKTHSIIGLKKQEKKVEKEKKGVDERKKNYEKEKEDEEEDQKKQFTVKYILSLTRNGQKFLKHYNSKSEFIENGKRILINEIINYYIKKNIDLSKELCYSLVEDIVKMFPKEKKDSFFDVNKKGNLIHKLYNTYQQTIIKLNKQKTVFSVHEILTTTIDGQKFLKDYNAKSKVDENVRKFLVKEIVCYYIKLKRKMSPTLYSSLAAEIVKMFPTETKNTYYCTDINGRLSGRLYDAYNDYEKEMTTMGPVGNQENHFTVHEILSTTIDGQKFLKNYSTKSKIRENEMKFLVKEIVCYYIKRKIKISPASYNSLAAEIVKMFPKESKDTYFRIDAKARLRGRLYNSHYRYEKQALTAKMKTVNEEHFTVKQILSSTTKGQKLLRGCTLKGELNEIERKFLLTEIANYYVKHKMILSCRIIMILAEEIVSIFPKELIDTYWSVDKQGRRRSKIYNVYYRIAKQTKTNKKVIEEKHFTVKEILSSTVKGQKFLNDYNNNPIINVQSRKFLMTEIANYYTDHNSMLSLRLSLLLVKEITQIFPTECKDTYFHVDKRGKLRGKLYDYYYKANQLKMNKSKTQ